MGVLLYAILPVSLPLGPETVQSQLRIHRYSEGLGREYIIGVQNTCESRLVKVGISFRLTDAYLSRRQ